MITKKLLRQAYERYGFSEQLNKNEDVAVFSIRTGHYHNADIIPLNNNVNTSTIFTEYTELGYACQIKRYNSIEEVHTALFSGFFNLEATRERLIRDYNEFTNALVKIHSERAAYSYIKTQYLVNNRPGDSTVINEILDRLDEDKPILFLVEAAAGFGKTCSAYELIKEIVHKKPYSIPLFSELSRNRQAKIFRYVLLDEIDRSFPLLSSSLVRGEIKSGKVPVVLDGFDELLHESVTDDEKNYESTEPMLETISELLIARAKVVLTTRRTAIFDGDDFHQWIQNHENDFDVVRIRINEPQVEDWLSENRLERLKNSGFPIENISNPVLLSFLRCISDDEFEEVTKQSTKLVDKYFSSMMERERIRQDLIMEPKEQYKILRSIADDMIEFDYTSEARDYIYNLILENNQVLIENTRKYYPAETRPTTDELVNKLTSHALLDRNGKESQGIGFVNEFVLGNFCADNIIDNTSMEWDGDKRFIEPAIISYLPRTKEEKELLWESLKFVLEFMNGYDKVRYNYLLTENMLMNLDGENIEDLHIENINFAESSYIKNSTFINCKFTNCNFHLKEIYNSTFINCDFYNCKLIPSAVNNEREVYFAGCNSDNDLISLVPENKDNLSVENEEFTDCDIYVLERFYPRGSQTFYKHRAIGAICTNNKYFNHIDILNSIDKLKIKEFLLTPEKRSFLEINIDMIGDIKTLLGRA